MPGLMVDGEMMADTAVSPDIIEALYPFSSLKGGANVLICPNLESANIAYKLLAKLGGAEQVGPILLGHSQAGVPADSRERSGGYRERDRHGRAGCTGTEVMSR